ncbi:MAG: 6-phosphofructokinase [Candidatus Marinimicrobia bacterium]|nr:6-phosphofructokinase [Candidatus Neomarinimicrobiota bacterium]MCF7880272.1 6-phosphofructokinase [Candidatus Neomarinimicrobiota bacterium]
MKVGILTGGGDCPGLNAVIRAATKKMISEYGYEVHGIRDGWRGLVDDETFPLNIADVEGVLKQGGTMLNTSRTNPFKDESQLKSTLETIKNNNFDAVMAIGGDDTLGAATRLYEEHDIPTVGVPKTIDNDLNGTDYTFGFDTAVSIATDAIDRCRTTAASHHRTLVVEVMGRHAGWIALHSGIASGADIILLPEFPFSMKDVNERLRKSTEAGQKNHIVVVAEGATMEDQDDFITKDQSVDEFGHVKLGGIADLLADQIEKSVGLETRSVILGHIQRGGTPTARDRVLSTRFGLKAADMVANKNFGQMAALQGDNIVNVPLTEATGELKVVTKELYDLTKYLTV